MKTPKNPSDNSLINSKIRSSSFNDKTKENSTILSIALKVSMIKISEMPIINGTKLD